LDDFAEYKRREGWWFLAFAILFRDKCESTPKQYQKTVSDFVDYLAYDAAVLLKGRVDNRESYGKK